MNGPVRLYQYWNTTTPPEEVRVLLDTWARDPGVTQQVFDHARARAYLGGTFGSRLVAAFDACANPALQSDLFRWAILYAEGGLYADADLGSRGRIPELIHPAPLGLLVALDALFATDLIFARQPRLPLLGRLLERVVTNIEARASNNVSVISGPGLLMSLFDDPATRHLFDGWLVETRMSALRTIAMPRQIAYKSGETDWRNVFMSRSRSVFSTSEPVVADPPAFSVDGPAFGRLQPGAVPLIQYADTAPIDDKGVAIIDTWRSDPLFRYHFFDQAAATEYLTRTCKPAMVKAFGNTEGEDRRAELLALVWLRNEGGLFVRNGLMNRGGWDWLLAAAPGGLMTERVDPVPTNDILYAPSPRSPLIITILKMLSRKLAGDGESTNPKVVVVPPKIEAIIWFLYNRLSLVGSDFTGWRIENRHSLSRFLSRPP